MAQRPARLGTRLILSYVLMAVAIMVVFTIGTGALLFLQMRSQLAHFAVEDIETVEGLLSATPAGLVIVREDYHNHAESRNAIDYYIEVLSPEGEVLYKNEKLGNGTLGERPTTGEGIGGYSPRWTTLADGTPAVLVSRRHVLGDRPILIRLAQTEEPVYRAIELFAVASALIFPIVIGIATLAAWRMSRRILAPVQNIAARAGQITSNRLYERLPVTGSGDEIDQLAEVFNRTLVRLEESFRQLRQFTSDASHELRTPLAALRAVGEVGLERDGTKQEYRELVGSMLEEVTRLTRLLDELLMLSRGDAGFVPLQRSPIVAINLVRDTTALLEPLAEEKKQKFDLSGDAGAVVTGDPVFLRQALINVVHNAIKYSSRSATIFIRVERLAGTEIAIVVRDEGPGIAAEHLPHIFDRFYRVDAGRSRNAGGFGLGLAIAQWAVKAHGGRIVVSSQVGDGTTFCIVLPAAERA